MVSAALYLVQGASYLSGCGILLYIKNDTVPYDARNVRRSDLIVICRIAARIFAVLALFVFGSAIVPHAAFIASIQQAALASVPFWAIHLLFALLARYVLPIRRLI